MINAYAPSGPKVLNKTPPIKGPSSIAMFIPTVLKAAPLPMRSCGNVSATRDWAEGI